MATERFMRHYYGASGYVKPQDKRSWEESFDKWWSIHGLNYPDQKYFARWIWSAAWNEREEQNGKSS